MTLFLLGLNLLLSSGFGDFRQKNNCILGDENGAAQLQLLGMGHTVRAAWGGEQLGWRAAPCWRGTTKTENFNSYVARKLSLS